MNDLKLIPGNESRNSGYCSADDYDVALVDTGETVGRIYARTSADKAPPEMLRGQFSAGP